MNTRVRRTKEQLIADLKAKLAVLEKTTELLPEHADVKAIVKAVEKAAGDNGWTTRAVMRTVMGILGLLQTRNTRKNTTKSS